MARLAVIRPRWLERRETSGCEGPTGRGRCIVIGPYRMATVIRPCHIA